jgi:hypothetical protein
VARFVANTISVLLNITLVVAILGYFGVQTTSFAALIAACALAIGTAWAGLLASFAAGAFLIVLRPFKVGDFITAGGVTGTVQEIGLFVTTFDTPDNVRTYVGNNKIFSDTIQNYTTNPYRRVELTAQISGSADPTLATTSTGRFTSMRTWRFAKSWEQRVPRSGVPRHDAAAACGLGVAPDQSKSTTPLTSPNLRRITIAGGVYVRSCHPDLRHCIRSRHRSSPLLPRSALPLVLARSGNHRCDRHRTRTPARTLGWTLPRPRRRIGLRIPVHVGSRRSAIPRTSQVT